MPNGFPDKVLIGQQSEVVFSDMQQRTGAMPVWANGKNGKEHRATMGMKPLINIFSIGAGGPARWVDSVQTDAEIRVWVAEGVANGMRPCFVKFGAVVTDKRWLDNIEKMYSGYYANEKYLKNTKPIACVALVTYEPTLTAAGQPWQQNGGDHLSGMYHALLEGRIPFEMVHPNLMDEKHLAPFKLLILANVTSLSDQQCDQLRQFVKKGGSIVSTFETSLYDENSQQRPDFGLADLFGVSFDKSVEGSMKNSYLKLRKDPLTNQFHPVLRGLEEAQQIINGFYRLKVNPKMDFPKPVTLIPSYPDLPMEEVYKRVPDPDTAELFLRELNKSRIAYFPWDIDRAFWQLMTPDHRQLLTNTIKWALNEDPLVEIEGPSVILFIAEKYLFPSTRRMKAAL